MKKIIKLSKKQEQAVLFGEGAILVKAGAGSGKTRVLTERIKRLLPKTERKILAITFTNKAGEEMKERLQDIPNIGNRLFIGTFHGFCQKILENHGISIGITQMPDIFENEADRLRLVEQAIELTPSYYQQYSTNDLKGKRDFCYRALGFISKIKRDICSPEEETLDYFKDENIALFFSSYQDILGSQNAIDFDDLILLAYKLFTEFPKIAAIYRRNYEYICVDEAQDLNNAQYQFLLALTNDEHKNVMFVGDPNQSIFAFTGSSAKFMGQDFFIKHFKPLVIELNENYRSSIKVIEAAKKIMPQANHITNAVIDGVFEIYSAANEDDEANWIIKKINSLVGKKYHDDIEGEITYEKIAILARTKFVFKQLEESLKDNNIPYYYKITPGALEFETKYMRVFDLALRIKLNPHNKFHQNQLMKLIDANNISTNLVHLALETTTPYSKVLEFVHNLKDDGSNLEHELENFKLWIIENSNKDDDENERKMIVDEINDIISHWHNYAKKTDNKSIRQFKTSMALGQTHPLSQNNGITLSTVHTMKGQQNEIIFVIGVDEGTFPYYKAIKKGGIEMTQENNNIYVAFTRAKRFLFITWPQKRTMPWGDTMIRRTSRFLKIFK